MKKRLLKWVVLPLSVLLLIYLVWSSSGRVNDDTVLTVHQNNIDFTESGADSGRGNIIGIQPYLRPPDFCSPVAFENTLRAYFDQLKSQNKFHEKTVVVLPEYIGTWLVAANEKASIYRKSSITGAMTIIVTSNLFSFLSHYFQSAASDPVKYAIFSMKAGAMARQYQQVFSRLAKDYRCCIVAGSIVLPDASLNKDGNISIAKKGALYNTSAVFDANGKIVPPLVKKIFPIDAEQPFTACGKTDQVPIYSTKAGKMGLLICADSWYPEAYTTIADKVDFVVVPSLANTDSEWLAPWSGYNGYKAPSDVDTTDYHSISEGDAWVKYSMGHRAVHAGIHNGLNVFFTGDIWDMHPQGRVLMLRKDSLTVLPAAIGKGRIVNMWLQ